MGLFGLVLAISTTIGPLVGAGILQIDIAGLHWRPMFFINVPLALAAVAGVWRNLPDPRTSEPLRLDLGGAALLSLALICLMYPLVEGRSLGWPAWTWAMLAASIPGLALFAVHQSRRRGKRSPLVPMSLFAKRSFAGGLVVQLIFVSGFAGYSLAVSLTLQVCTSRPCSPRSRGCRHRSGCSSAPGRRCGWRAAGRDISSSWPDWRRWWSGCRSPMSSCTWPERV
jgi:MFS family permease